MPNLFIPNARHSTLKTLADGVESNDPKLELRSKGDDLYGKEGPPKGRSEDARTTHRQQARYLLVANLCEQYKCESLDAECILRNVLDDSAPYVAVGDIRELHRLSIVANGFMDKHKDRPVVAFEEARLAEWFKARGMTDDDADASAVRVELAIKNGCSEESSIKAALVFEKVLKGAMAVLDARQELFYGGERDAFVHMAKAMTQGLPAYDQSDPVEKMTWQTMAAIFRTSNFIPKGEVDQMNVSVPAPGSGKPRTHATENRKSRSQAESDKLDERTMGLYARRSAVAAKSTIEIADCTRMGNAVAQKVLSGDLSAIDAKQELTDRDARDAFFDALKTAMAKLPPFDKCKAKETKTWYNIAAAFGTQDFVPFQKTQGLGTSCKASMLQAMKAKLLTIDFDEVNEVATAYASLRELHKLIQLEDVVGPDDLKKLSSFVEHCRADQTLIHARANWPNLNFEDRKTAIARMIELHAKEFGYKVPANYLDIRSLKETTLGVTSADGSKLTITAVPLYFDDFWCVFNAVSHESTHKYQRVMEEELMRGRIDPKSPLYDRARLMKANFDVATTEEFHERAGIRPGLHYGAYRRQPVEVDAFYKGDLAEYLLRNKRGRIADVVEPDGVPGVDKHPLAS